MKSPIKQRVVCLFGTGIIFDKTLSVLLDNDIEVVGVCNANKHTKKVDFSYLKIAVKKYGYWKVFLQILGRFLYKILNARKDKEIFNQIYNDFEIQEIIKTKGGGISYHSTTDYAHPETISWLKEQKADMFIIHTGYWVGKKVRNIVDGKCLGGHPGITPTYRGVHSPFWAVYNDDWDNIGYSVFWVDGGVDTGDILAQGRLNPEKNDSFFTMSWKGMVGIAEQQAKIIKKIENGEDLTVRKVGEVSEDTNYTHPTIFQYLKYIFKQNRLR
ncbi:MAG: formyltransferase family protein [Flavobacteriaceae bacterium]|nr:formyltransferase family protein [Flavobacteriaceae bacterium]